MGMASSSRQMGHTTVVIDKTTSSRALECTTTLCKTLPTRVCSCMTVYTVVVRALTQCWVNSTLVPDLMDINKAMAPCDLQTETHYVVSDTVVCMRAVKLPFTMPVVNTTWVTDVMVNRMAMGCALTTITRCTMVRGSMAFITDTAL